MPEQSPECILIFRIGQLGDTLVSVPALRAIQQTYPDAELVYLHDQHIRKSYVLSRDVLCGAGLVDFFVSYPVGYSYVEKAHALLKLIRIWLFLRKKKIDMVIRLDPERRSKRQLKRDHWFFRSLGIANEVSVAPYRSRPAKPPFLVLQEHESDFYLRALDGEGIGIHIPGQGDASLGLTVEDEQEWKENYSTQIADSRPLVALGVGSKMQSKQWPLDSFYEVLTGLISSCHVMPVFLGGPEDREASGRLIQKLGSGLNLCGELSIRGSASLMQHCRFYLGNDTGTMHLAVAAGIPCVAVFSARDVPGKWYPYGNGHIVHRVPVECEGCMLYECVEMKRKCLTAISVESVLESCREILTRESDDVPLIEVTDQERRIFQYPGPDTASA